MRKCLRCFLALALHLSVLFSEGVNNRVPGAILPTEAASKGVSQTQVGFINSVFNLSRCICTIPLLNFVHPRTTKKFFILGSVIAGLLCVVFGELIRIKSSTAFVWTCLMARFIMGIGTSMIWASMTSLALLLYPRNPGTTLALIQLALAFGELVGSPLTSLLYFAGGYSMPFRVTGLAQCLLAICYYFMFPNPQELTEVSLEKTTSGFRTSIFKFIFCPGIINTSLALLFVTVFMGFLSSAFATYLLEVFQIGQSTAGVYFIPYSFGDMASALFFGKMVDRGYSGLVYCLGSVLHTGAVLGTALPLISPQLVNMIFIQCMLALAGLGLNAVGTSGIPVYDEIAQQNNIDSKRQIKIFCSSWLGFMFAFGQLIGQGIFGGFLYKFFDFYRSCLLQGAIGVVVSLLVFSYLVKHNLLRASSVDSDFEGEELHDEEKIPLMKLMQRNEIMKSNLIKDNFNNKI